MNEESDCDHNVDAVIGPVDCVGRVEVFQKLNEIKHGKAREPSDVSLGLFAPIGEVGIEVMVELCQGVPNIFGMSAESALSAVVSVFMGKVTSYTAASTQSYVF